jgi:hypothetical protein
VLQVELVEEARLATSAAGEIRAIAVSIGGPRSQGSIGAWKLVSWYDISEARKEELP